MTFRYMIERRPDVSPAVESLAEQRRVVLSTLLGGGLVAQDIIVCAPDGAPIAGRNACRQIERWLQEASYSDIVLDATGMSRSTCFPAFKQLVEHGRANNVRVHLLVADSEATRPIGIESISGDRGDWIHGFLGDVDLDKMSGALKLWVVQLKEGSEAVLHRLFTQLESPGEVCPIVPFPSAEPRRGDKLLFSLRERWQDDWGESPLSLIYADESDPTDVYRSVVELHTARRDALEGASVASTTILSPLGGRISSIGMLLAALEQDLPLYYLETVGYNVPGSIGAFSPQPPDHLWCFRFHPT